MSLRNDASLLKTAVVTGVRRPSGPFKITAVITWVCEQHCRHCNIWRRERGNELSVDQWRQVFRNGRDHLRWVDLTGGEVTSRGDFADIAIAAVEECPRLAMLHFPTNGGRPDVVLEAVDAIQTAGPARLVLSVSLDGPPAVHDKLRGDKGSFERATRTFREVRDRGVPVYFGMTLSPWNIDQLDTTFEALRDAVPGLRWADLHHNFLHHSPHYFQNQELDRNEPHRLRAAVRRLIARRGLPLSGTEVLESLYLSRVEAYTRSGRSPVPCTSLSGNCFIQPDGTVHPCHIWERPVGALTEHGLSLASLWSSTSAEEARDEVIADRCPGCWSPCEAYPSLLADLGRRITPRIGH
ncbi:MAG TPA: hypothetical protein DIU15_07505 [Deltaproteobacteria bacterium]|nr:hypothetical protein [Deltaproteobacteria bacterium]HCP45871.1 hypothetical protein [Deltaproteobacteria bacterium]